jgi:hypothetical protein
MWTERGPGSSEHGALTTTERIEMKQITVYEVDSDRGTYWESNPFVPEIWESGIVEEDPWPTIKALSEAGYEVVIKSHAAYLQWLVENHEPSD